MALIPYAEQSDLPPEVRERAAELPIGNLIGMLANAPALVGPTLRLGGAILTESKLDPVLRELAILRVAALTGSEYEWVQHAAIARMLEIDDDKVKALEADSVREGPLTGASRWCSRSSRKRWAARPGESSFSGPDGSSVAPRRSS
jgi:4-carboxymuconolactone decarboxylase